MLKPQQPSSSGRKTSNGTSGSSTMSSAASGINTSNRTTVGRTRSVKPPFQSPPVFEGVYNNARMLHFLTAVVGSTCDVRVKNGTVYEGIFKTLSSRCELAVDAVHRRGEGESPTAPPRREEITDTMIFSPNDLVTMTCRDVDLNYATRDTFTDTAISSGRVNGEHKEKVLQRWEGGDSNGESYDLETDASNGWDANEMFRYNEENYGVKSTYDASLSMYTVPLERGNSDNFRAREARAARLASEIESSPQYRHRVALENDDGKTEEDKYSAVMRDAERERGRESPRERGRDSPSGGSREGKYIPLPQRAREMGGSGGGLRGDRVSERSERGGRGGYHPSRSTPPSSSPRPPLPPATTGGTPSERGSPLPGRGGYTPSSPPSSHSHTHAAAVPHSHSLPHALSDAGRPVNGVPSRTSPKSQRPHQPNRPVRPSNTHPPTVSRSPKSDTPSQDPSAPYVDSSPVSMAKQKPSGPTPLFPVDVNEISKERAAAAAAAAAEAAASPDDGKSSKAPSAQQRSQIEELRKFGKEFRLQPSPGAPSSPGAAAAPAASATGPSEAAQPGAAGSAKAPSAADAPSAAAADGKPSLAQSPPGQPPAPASPAEEPGPPKDKEAAATPAASLPVSDRQSPATLQPARTPGPEESRPETATEAVTDQVKRSTLNPNAKEFNPNKPPVALSKPTSAPTPPRPTPPSPSVLLQQHPGGQGPMYSASYLPYNLQLHPVQAQQMYQYPMQAVNQGKYPRAKGSVVPQRPDHSSSAPPMLQAASAAGAPLVASPYPPSPTCSNNPPQYGQQQVIQAMGPYPGQPMYSMLQGGARMLGSGGGHPQALGPPAGPQFPGQGEGPQGPQQGIYAAQSFSHHSGPVHPPQPSSTPTGSQPPPQHTAPSPGQTGQSGPQPQSLYHSGPLSAPTPPNLPPGHSSPQASYPLQGYSLHGHQGIPHTYTSLGQIAQAHVQGPMSGPHPSGSHGPPPMVMLHAPPQAGPGSAQHPQHGPQQGPPQHFTYIHPQAVQVQHQTQQHTFHPPGN
ncbi:LOW QUALITY PROTEIN: ataxin-2-like protein [Alosa sapidissima]|uniref:LOW QUALITY PROTEIN: ataxin-2-like protein n=1 Tax=Alosa sapidissima TaxID=34773 RepID=UPI001C0944FB|nr:LOW QUALITY PROTEIN: ataxin-2-like protein [Alosa sapidissima]